MLKNYTPSKHYCIELINSFYELELGVCNELKMMLLYNINLWINEYMYDDVIVYYFYTYYLYVCKKNLLDENNLNRIKKIFQILHNNDFYLRLEYLLKNYKN